MSRMIDLHTDAITRLLEGNEEDCVATLLACLNLAKSCTLNALPMDEKTPSEDYNLSGMIDPCIFEVSLEEVIHPNSIDTTVERSSVDANVRLYRNVFGTDGLDTIRDRPTLIQFVALATYNLGIIYHERASLKCDVQTLAKAKSLYKFAFQLVSSEQASQGVLDLTALELALFNNLGHLCAFLLDLEGYIQCRDMLQAKLAVVHPGVVDESAIQIFKHNCWSGRNQIATTIAPAA